jgi:hypothetical protein
MKKFRYKTEGICEGLEEEITMELDKFGAEGWELVSIVKIPQINHAGEYCFFAFFKQEYED